MAGSVRFLGAVTLGVLLGSSCVANAQTVQNAQAAHHPVRHPAAAHQIIVHPRPSYLTAGVGASVGSHNGYVLDTLKPPQRDTIQGTFVGLRGVGPAAEPVHRAWLGRAAVLPLPAPARLE